MAVSDDGTVMEVFSFRHADAVYYDGIITPGFVNTHCHLELSHLKDQVAAQKGMASFIGELVPKRNSFSETEIKNAIANAESEMIKNGIVAVGGISNTNHTFEQKAKQNLFYHTFIELFDLGAEKADEIFSREKNLKSQISNLKSSLSPHAPYTVSPALFTIIDNLQQEITCIHNQESKAEDDLFKNRTGDLFDAFSKLGIALNWIKAGKTSVHYSLPQMLQSKKIQLVHNTYTGAEDLQFIKSKTAGIKSKIYLCTCPNANLYIENKLPDYNLLRMSGFKMTIGTDSLASNYSLSILDEMKTIQKNYPEIEFAELLQWATINGAEFLGIDNFFGSIEQGKKCGLNLIANLDTEKLSINEKTSVQKII